MWKTKAEAVLPALSQLLNTVLKPGHYNTVWKSSAQTLQDLDGLLYMKYLPRYSGRGRTELKWIYTVWKKLNSQLWEVVSVPSTYKSPDTSLVTQRLSGSFQSCNLVLSPKRHAQGLPRHNLLTKSCLSIMSGATKQMRKKIILTLKSHATFRVHWIMSTVCHSFLTASQKLSTTGKQ